MEIRSWGYVTVSEFNKEARISARVHISEKEKLKKTGYNAREAIEYFNSIAGKRIESLKIEEYFLNKEIEDMREELIRKERRLEQLQKTIDEFHIDKVSSLRVDSYQKIIDLYNRDITNISFEEFVNGNYIQEKFINVEVGKFPDCDVGEYCNGLLDYYNDVILVSKTF